MWPFGNEEQKRIAALERRIRRLEQDQVVIQGFSGGYCYDPDQEEGYKFTSLGTPDLKAADGVRLLIKHLGLEFKKEQNNVEPAALVKLRKK